MIFSECESEMEISHYTRYIVGHGNFVDAFVLATHHLSSPLIQGGLEIPIKLVLKLTITRLIVQNYKNTVNMIKTTESLLMDSSQVTLRKF